jgi:hypothetical protein
MGVDDNKFQITDLSDSQTFLEWFNKTNDEVINKLNLLEVYGATGADGISASVGTSLAGYGSGILEVEMSGNVSKGISFQDITVHGALNYSFSNSEIKSVTQFSGSTSGFSFGQVVRASYIGTADGFPNGNTLGITFARAANSTQAEAIGIVSSVQGDPGTVNVVTNGRITGNFVPIVGATLSAGCVYFLDPTTYGGLTTIEPNISGQVSKPVLIGLTGDTGLVINYRGQELGFSGGTGSGIGALRILVDVDSGSNFTLGTFVARSSETIVFGGGDSRTQDSVSKIYPASAADPFDGAAPSRRDLLGIITDIRGNVLEILVRGYLPLSQVVTEGGIVLSHSPFFLSGSNNGKSLPNSMSNVQLGHIIDSNVVFIDPIIVDHDITFTNSNRNFFGGNSGGAGISYGINSFDPVINGSFDIWQRHIGSSGLFEGGTASNSTYFADRWVLLNGITSYSPVGGTFGIQRLQFTPGQRDVLGEPTYYSRITNNYARTASTGFTGEDFLHVENRLDSSEYFMDRTAVISVYTRTGAAGATLGVLYKQYFDNGVGLSGASTTTNVGEITLSTGWNANSFSFSVPNNIGKPITGTEHYAAIAFDIKGVTGTYVDFSQLQFQLGTNPIVPFKKDPDIVLDQCRKFYQRSYDKEVVTRTPTMIEENVPDLTVVDIPVNYTKDYYYNFPVKMRSIPEVILYSPNSGVTNDAFNRLAGKDMRLTSGTQCVQLGVERISKVNMPTIQVGNTGESGIRFEIVSGACPNDNVSVHYVADSDNNSNL